MTSSDSVRSHPLKYKAPRSTKLEHTSIKKNGLQLSEPPIFNYFFSRIRQEARAEAWYFAHIRYFNGLRTPQNTHTHTHTQDSIDMVVLLRLVSRLLKFIVSMSGVNVQGLLCILNTLYSETFVFYSES